MEDDTTKQEALLDLERHLADLNHNALQRELDSDHDSIQDDYDSLHRQMYKRIQRNRYFSRKKKYRNKTSLFDVDDCLSPDSICYNSCEFRYDF
jgi:hypothetical protein